MKKIFLVFILILFIGFLGYVFFNFPKTSTATIRNHTFFIDIARTQSEQEVGLAKYQTLPQNKGMYFPFDHADYYTFWMKNMHFPIDIIFINNGKIVTIYSNVQAEKNYQEFLYKPTSPSNAILEISAGLSKKYGFKIGDPVIISY